MILIIIRKFEILFSHSCVNKRSSILRSKTIINSVAYGFFKKITIFCCSFKYSNFSFKYHCIFNFKFAIIYKTFTESVIHIYLLRVNIHFLYDYTKPFKHKISNVNRTNCDIKASSTPLHFSLQTLFWNNFFSNSTLFSTLK